MVHHNTKHSNTVKRNGALSGMSNDECFMISGNSSVFGTKENIASLTPINEVADLNLPFDVKDLVNIYCGYNVVFYVTKTDIYSKLYTYEGGMHERTGELQKIVMPNGIDLSPSLYIKKISSGSDHTMILLCDGTLICYGLNGDGQLGIDTKEPIIPFPRIVNPEIFSKKKIMDVVCGYYHTIVLTEDRHVYVAGRNCNFQIGINTYDSDDSGPIKKQRIFTRIDIPTVKSNEKIIKIVSSSHNSCVLTDAGILYGTGYNMFDTLGSTGSTMFTPIEPFHTNEQYVKDVWCTTLVSFVKLDNDDIYTCGKHEYVELFTAPVEPVSKYTKNDYLSGKNIDKLCGLYTLSAVDENNENLYMAGENSYKQIVDSDKSIIINYKNEKISKILKMKSYSSVNIQGGFRICSMSLTRKNGYTKNLCNMYANLYSSIFSDYSDKGKKVAPFSDVLLKFD